MGRRDELRFWLVVLLAGVAAGLVGIAVTELLHAVQHAAFGWSGPTFYDDVVHAGPGRRLVVVISGGVLAGVGWLAIRRWARVATIDRSTTDVRPGVIGTTLDGCLQVVVVALGASLGREGAPRQIAAAGAGRLARICALPPDQVRLVVAAAAGAGLAAVYNVPLAGCLYAVGVVLGRAGVRAAVAALACSAVATAVSWTVLPDRPVYGVPGLHPSASVVVLAAVLGPVAGLAATAFRYAAGRARAHAPVRWRLPLATTGVFAALGAASLAYPQLLGNGRAASDLALTAHLTLGTALVLALLKPLATIACLGSGAVGGLLTPSLAAGALLGTVGGRVWEQLWPTGNLGACALIGAVAFVAVTQRAPVFALVLVMELTGADAAMLLPLAVAVGAAHLVAGRARPSSIRGRTASRSGSPTAGRPMVRSC